MLVILRMQLFLLRLLFSFLLTGLHSATILHAQYSEDEFTRYTFQDGLSDNGIGCLLQDEQGYLWIGTETGLNRFDGHSFKKYFQGTPPLHLRSGSIIQLIRYDDHRIGIVTRNGFHLLDINDYSVKDFLIQDSSALSTYLNAPWDAEELNDGSFAISTAAGFNVFDNEGKITFRHDAYRMEDIGKKRILFGRDIFRVGNDKLFVYVNESGLAEFDIRKKSLHIFDPADKDAGIFSHHHLGDNAFWVVKQQLSPDEFAFIPFDTNVIILYQHSLNKKIVSSLPFNVRESLNWTSRIEMLSDSVAAINHKAKGFYLLNFDRETGKFTSDGKLYLPQHKIHCLYQDRDGRLWAGTSEGLLKQDLQHPFISSYRYIPEGNEKYSSLFTCTYRVKDKLYAGRFGAGKGLIIINAADMRMLREVSFYEEGSPWNAVLSIEMYHPDTLWIGTNGGMVWYDTKSGTYGKAINEKKYPWSTAFYPIMAPPRSDGYAWMCSLLDGKVARYHIPSRTFTLFTSQTEPALPFDRVKSVVYDAYGDVWIGGHSLARWNNRLQEFDTLITVYGGMNKFNDDIVTLSADKEGSLWLHNSFNGLLEYKIREKKFVPYSMKDGMPTDILHSLSLAREHKLWMAGNNHLILFDTYTKKFTVFDNADGFPEQKPTGRRIMYDAASGQMFLCSYEHIATFPMVPEEKRDNSSGLIIQEVTVDHEMTYYQPGYEMSIDYSQNNLSLNYTVIDFEKSNYQFAYRLHYTDPWNVIGDQRNISLTHLPPGRYTIQVRASGSPGIEKTNKLFLIIRSPLWKRAWFITIVTVAVLISLYLILRNRIRYIRQRANIDKLLAQTEIKALQAQMNPHFIFNSLNSIGQMILNNENKEASHYLSKFARLIRITLDQSSKSMVSLRNTIDYLERYMEMENIRNSYFTHEIHVDDSLDIDETAVPPMLIQPFIENAVWHGVTANNKRIHVRIDFIKEGDNLICKIDDNGIGIQQSDDMKSENGVRHQPVGIANIQNRVALLNEKYNLHGHISIMDKKDIPGSTGTGTLVTLQLPLEIEEV